MVDVEGTPFLEYQIGQLEKQGLKDIILCVGHLAHQIQHYFDDGRRWGVRISYSAETNLLGTAGAIKNAERFIEDTFLVLNGDSYLDTDFQAMVENHRFNKREGDAGMAGTIAAVAVENAAAYGTLELDAQYRILQFREKAGAGPGRINGGVYVLEPAILDLIPENRAVSIERETFPRILQNGGHLYGYPVSGFFVDVGTPDGYRRFSQYIEGERR